MLQLVYLTLQGFNGTMKNTCWPDIQKRTNATYDELAWANVAGSIGGLCSPLLTVFTDK